MGQPNPPGENVPLFEGMDPAWNEFASYVPEDKRGEFGSKLREKVSGYENQIKEYEPYAGFIKSGIGAEDLDTAYGVYKRIENNPREVYEVLAQHLNITPAQAQEVVEEINEGDERDPEIQALKEQVNTLAAIALANREQTVQEQTQSEADQWLESELTGLQAKVGDFPEEEIVMRMAQLNMTAEEAYQHYTGFVSEVRKSRPAPMIMGSGGAIPSRAVDVTKLDNKSTKNLVAQMLEHANAQGN